MSDDHHIRTDEYGDARSRPEARESLALRLHRHLVRTCSECADEWELLAGDQQTLRDLLRRAATGASELPDLPAELLSCYSEEVRREDEELRRVRAVRRKARMQIWQLLQARPGDRADKVHSAHVQYRSRAVAELLLEECRKAIRDDPAEAGNLASLVPWVLRVTPGAEGRWVEELLALARAWEANALRVAGDLPAADRAFAELRRDLALRPIEEPAVLGELKSLEASLRIGQRRTTQAAELLDHAALLCRSAGDREGEVRVLIKHGNLLVEIGRSEESLAAYERAAHQLEGTGKHPHLLCCTVAGCVVSLCDLERFEEAEQLLHRHADIFEDHLDAGALVRSLHGRIALGRGDLASAEQCFLDCREGCFASGRYHDAALACVDLALVYLEAGRIPELRRLAHDVLPLFQVRGVQREALAVLHLLSRTVAREPLDRSVLDDLRRRLHGPSPLPTRTST